MITTYLSTLKIAFNPFAASSKVPRLFLTLLPADLHKRVKISSTALPRTSRDPSILELGFTDGKVLKYSWAEVGGSKLVETGNGNGNGKRVSLKDIVEEVDRHARGLSRKEELSG